MIAAVAIASDEFKDPSREFGLGVQIVVCPAKGRSIGGCESRPRKPPEERGSQPPASGEIPALKRGEAKLQAATNVNSAASKEHPVRGRAGRARHYWAKTAALDSGAARNRSGVKETACSEGRLVNWGGVRPKKPSFMRVRVPPAQIA